MIESKGGESIKGMSIKDSDADRAGCRVAETLGIVGPATVQCFRTEEGRHEITDVNPRFGGGFPAATTPPAAAIRSSRSRSPAASSRSRGSARSARASS